MKDLQIELQELALEVMDMLAVALHFAGAQKQHIDTLIDCYLKELDAFDEQTPYGQEQMIALIHNLKEKYPQYF
ncbi:hypothetical protein BBW65_03385 [Helicobacter enhydrae]|uniref:Uncharacterized protein n=1 Tax=Helicobacter enhydrae TaxID=222136 RepID=A0A1B1U565_9HELI|nr:hypothetical protein [Helicobacter enhydrae]ANV97899.1 hypothetical protein BBW65_03385 [Helicobacter enhydrae]